MRKISWLWLVMVLVIAPVQAQEPKLYTAEPISVKGFNELIEGPACDAAGNLFCVGYLAGDNIARVTPDGKAEVYVTLPNQSYGNGIVFDPQGMMYVADYKNHNVLRVDPKTKSITPLVHEPSMNQPNDLAIAPDGTIYASDPNWKAGTGQLWKITKQGQAILLAKGMGTTNGIEVSPDGKTLYVNESVQRNVWSFDLTAEKPEKKLVKQFPDHGFDGMRADIEGNLYITRYGKGVVAVMSPQGEVIREIDVLGKKPSNLCFGGADGRTVYVTEVEHQRLVKFRVEKPGLAWQRWQEASQK
jgi:sugar lactone lactonase YvrE